MTEVKRRRGGRGNQIRLPGPQPPDGEVFEHRPRLTSVPPAADSCDAPASSDIRSQSAAASAPAAASGCNCRLGEQRFSAWIRTTGGGISKPVYLSNTGEEKNLQVN